MAHQTVPTSASEAIAEVVEQALWTVPCAGLFVPTRTGTTARKISRFKPKAWIMASSQESVVCQDLAFSYGVYPLHLDDDPEDWREFAAQWLRAHGVSGAIAMLVAGPSSRNPNANHRLEFLRLNQRVEQH